MIFFRLSHINNSISLTKIEKKRKAANFWHYYLMNLKDESFAH